MTDNAMVPQRQEERSESVRASSLESGAVVAEAAAAAYIPRARPELAKSQNTADESLPAGIVDEHGFSFGGGSGKDPRLKAAAAADSIELIDKNGDRQVSLKTFAADRMKEYEHAGMSSDAAARKYTKEYNSYW